MLKRGLTYVLIYVLLLVTALFGVWCFILARTTFQAALAQFYIQGSLANEQRAISFDQFFSIGLGLVWLAFVFATDYYFRSKAMVVGVLKCFAKVAGPELVLAFVMDLTLYWLQSGAGGSQLRVLILAAELVAGLILLLYGRSSRVATPSQGGTS